MDKAWVRTKKGEPCPVCARPDWCSVTADGQIAHCMRIQSDWACKKGGWFHRLNDPKPRQHEPAPKPDQTTYNFTHLAAMFRVGQEQADALAGTLGVSAHSLMRMGLGRMELYPMLLRSWGVFKPTTAWSFPMHDAGANVVGLRLRSDDGSKFAFTDSRSGLFLPTHWTHQGPLVIVEGPTDAAAVLDWGFDCVGRPSCNDGDDLIIGLLDGFKAAAGCRRDVVILANLDTAKTRPDGTTFYPGQEGAAALADKLIWKTASLRVIGPPDGVKDARAWKCDGGTREDVNGFVSAKGQWKPTKRNG